MRRLTPFALALLVLAGPAFAQAPAPAAPPTPLPAPLSAPPKLFASSADVQALIARARMQQKPDQPNLVQPIVSLAPYRANLEHRTGVGPAAVHEKEAELFYVIDGSGVLTTEGRLVNAKRTNPENLSGASIEGGIARPVAKGDVIFVPEGVPHWFNRVNGELILMSLHVPRSGAPG
jgi:mannose-6-phosphate isomerase-like protein (cupin superfamily)